MFIVTKDNINLLKHTFSIMYTIEELKALEGQFGSPMYLFREEDFVNNYKDFVSCFNKYYSKYQ